MGMGFAPTWLRHVSPLLHKTTLTTAYNDQIGIAMVTHVVCASFFQGSASPRIPKRWTTESPEFLRRTVPAQTVWQSVTKYYTVRRILHGGPMA